jgi:serine/threonine protein kinase
MEGQLIAEKYVVIRKLGEGASGVVYLVSHKDLNIRLALKILKSDFSSDAGLLDLFKREAETLFRFSHEGCVQLRDFGKLNDGAYFMATDFSEGGTLRDLLQRTGRLEVQYTLHLLDKVLEVLGAAHDLGIVHRDIKPENVMIERDYRGRDKIKVLDFGVAHLLAMEVANNEDSDANFGAAGTPCYMSPEQALGEKSLDGRVDIYSVGIMGYEMLIGRLPFDHEDLLQILCQQVTQPPEPFPSGFFIPQKVEELIQKSLAKAREDRFQNAGRFRAQIAEILKLYEQGVFDDQTIQTGPVQIGGGVDLQQVVHGLQKDARASSINNLADELSVPSGKASGSDTIVRPNIVRRRNTNQDSSVDDVEPFDNDELESSDSDVTTVQDESSVASLNVMLLDDDQNLLNMMTHILTHGGMQVFAATDVGSIHTNLFMSDVQLLITDVNMPKIDGVKVCQLFKKTLPNLKILLFSNVPERELAKLTKEAGADGFISKQGSPKEWLESIQSLSFEPGI